VQNRVFQLYHQWNGSKKGGEGSLRSSKKKEEKRTNNPICKMKRRVIAAE
jgi:hypothetical protein